MRTSLLGLAAAGMIAICGTAPALALCNPGTPNCIKANSPWLTKAQQQIHQGDGNFNCDPGPAGICSDDLPGSALKPSSHLGPKGGGARVAVAPEIQ